MSQTRMTARRAFALLSLDSGIPATKAGRKLQEELGLGLTSGALCSELHRLAKSYARIQERWCSEEMTDAVTAGVTKREARIETRITEIVKALNLKGVKFTGDPRGFCVRVFRADGKFNTWGGAEEGWGIA